MFFNKILKDLFIFFTFALVIVSLILWVFQLTNYIDLIINDGKNIFEYFTYSLLRLPKIISEIFIFTYFFSLMFIISKYEDNNELIVLWTNGISKIKLVNFFLKLSIFIFIIQIVLNLFIVPISEKNARNIARDNQSIDINSLLLPKKFNDQIRNYTFYFEEKLKDNTLLNVYIKQIITDQETKITYAKRGILSKSNDKSILKLINGENFVFKDGKVTKLKFAESTTSLSNLMSQKATYSKMSEIPTVNLLKCILKLNNIKNFDNDKKFDELNRCALYNLDNIYIEFYDRFFFALFVIPLTVISGFFILFSKLDKNYNILKLSTFFSGLLILILSIILNRYINVDLSRNIIIYSSPIIFGIIIYIILLIFLKFYENNKLLK